MKIYEEILERLRNRESLDEVRRDYRSASQFAQALRIYSDELTEQVENKRCACEQEAAQLKEYCC
jgi:uncharacterized protein (DUF433 family)